MPLRVRFGYDSAMGVGEAHERCYAYPHVTAGSSMLVPGRLSHDTSADHR